MRSRFDPILRVRAFSALSGITRNGLLQNARGTPVRGCSWITGSRLHSATRAPLAATLQATKRQLPCYGILARSSRMLTSSAESEAFTETAVSFPSADGFVIHGTFTAPGAGGGTSTPLVVIVQGSGTLDRDGNAAPIRLDMYSRLAHFLASIGVASVRYDKRGTHASAAPPGGRADAFLAAGIDDLAADAAAAVSFGAARAGVDRARVFVAGHSEGAILMGRICKTVARNYPALPPLKGVMIVCGFGETLKMAVDHQFEQIVTSIDRHGSFFQRKFVKPLLSLCGLDSSAFLTNFVLDEKNKDKDVTTFWFRPFPLRWFREHYQLDLVEEGKEIRCPALVIGGGKDFQLDAKYCTREMTDALLVNSPRVEIAVIPKMTHILRDTDAGDVSIWEAQEQYKVQGREPLSQELMEVMKRFVLHP